MLPRLRTPARPRARRILAALAGLLAIPLAAACEPEVGKPCGPKDYVDARVVQQPGKNDLVRNFGFEDCSQGLCASVDGSRPFCTRTCETDLDCAADGFVCDRLVTFGPLACSDWSAESDCVKPDGSFSDSPIRYCVAPRDVIEKRDCDFGRGEDPERCEELRERFEGGGL